MADIKNNLVFLSESITNLPGILLHLIQGNIISENEGELIEYEKTSQGRNAALLTLLQKKDWEENKALFVKILRETNNEHCADVIEYAYKGDTDKIMNKAVARRNRLRTEENAKKLNVLEVLSIILAISVLSIAVLLQYMNSNISTTPSSPTSVVQDKTESTVPYNNVPIKQGNTVAINKESTTPNTEDNILQQQIWFEITALNRFYVGREKEKDLLDRYWNTSITQKTLSIVAVTGLGGVGKSELAKNYAKSFYENVEGHCIWIKSESNQSVEDSFRRLAQENLKISLNDHFGKEKKFLEIAEEVFEKLFGEKVLFVFDNVENFELPILQLLIDLSFKKPPTMLKPFLITTSRVIEANEYFGTLCNTLDLEILTKESAKQFFYNSLNVNEPPEDSIRELIEKLSERLHFFPLAMQQAAAYINEKLIFSGHLLEAIEDYLDQMENISKKLLNHKLPKYDSTISNTTVLTWRITFDKLREESGGLAIDIMNILSCLSPDDISTQMVTSILQKMGKVSEFTNVNSLFEIIRKYSMITFSREKSISVHRLVQEVTRIELEERGELLSYLNGVANSLKEMLTVEEISLKDIGHVQMMWKHLKKNEAMIVEHFELFVLLCHKYLVSGRYRDLLDFSIEFGHVLESAFGESNPLTLRFYKGAALGRLGRNSEAIEVLKYVYEKQKKIFGEDNEDCLQTADEIGGAYYELKKYEEAMTIYKDALEINERINGKEHRRTLSLKNGIAMVLRAQNKVKEALQVYKEVFEVGERVRGVEHPDTLDTKHNIASVKLGQEEYSEALKEFQEVMELQEKVREPNHPKTFITKGNIAVAYYHLGRLEESLQMFTMVHENLVQILGPRHPNTITTEGWIEKVELHIALLGSSSTEFSSIWSEIPTFVMDMFNAKDISLKELVNIQIIWKHLNRDKKMNEEDGQSLSSVCNKLKKLGHYKTLLDFSSKFGELVKSMLGGNNRWTLRMKYWKGIALRELGQYTVSMELLKDIWEIQKIKFGEDDDYCLHTARQVGSAYYLFEKYDEAMEIYENVLEKREMLGKELEETLTLKHCIALVLDAQNKHDEALKLYAEVLEVRDRLFGVENPDTLLLMYNIAGNKLQQKNYEEALKEFQEVLELEERVLELNHPHTLTTKYSIAVALYHLGRHGKCLELLKDVHQKRVKVLGPSHPVTINTLEWIDKVEAKIKLQRSMTEFPKVTLVLDISWPCKMGNFSVNIVDVF